MLLGTEKVSHQHLRPKTSLMLYFKLPFEKSERLVKQLLGLKYRDDTVEFSLEFTKILNSNNMHSTTFSLDSADF